MNIDPIHAADLRTAIHIKKALDNIYRLNKLGYCPTKVQKFRKYFNLDGREEEGSGNNTDEEDSSGGNETPEKGFKRRDLVNQVCKYCKKPFQVCGAHLIVLSGNP